MMMQYIILLQYIVDVKSFFLCFVDFSQEFSETLVKSI